MNTATKPHYLAVRIALGAILWSALVLILLAALNPARALAGTICVDGSYAGGNGNGSCWTNPYRSLQDALAVVQAGDEIWVARGVYTPGISAVTAFTIPPGVGVYGGFAATETLRSQSNWAANVTVLSGDIDGNDTYKDANGVVTITAGITGTNAYHVLWLDGTGSSVITTSTQLDGFIVTAGNASGSSPHSNGGGLYCNGEGSGKECSPVLANITFRANKAFSYGGAMFNQGFAGRSNPVLNSITFSVNHAKSGGAVFNNGAAGGTSSPALIQVMFSDNSAADGGGAMYNNGYKGTSSPALINVTFYANSAGAMGGAMCSVSSGNPLLTNVILWSNTAPNGSQMINRGARVAMQHSLVQDGWNGSGISNELTGLVTDGGGNLSGAPLFADADRRDLRLLLGSPAIDAGNTLSVPAAITTDLGGNPRVVNGVVDIGAYESQGFSLAVGAGNMQSVSVASTFAKPLLVTATSTAGEPVGPGGVIRFTSPSTGAGFSAIYTATTDFSGTASVPVAANTIAGSYSVTATASGVLTPAVFGLTNTLPRLSVGRQGTGSGSVTSSPAGIDCGTACTAEFGSGAVVTLTSTPDAGSNFTGWSGACQGTGACAINLTGSRAVTATFRLASPAILCVNTRAASNSPDGSCWANPYTSLQEVLAIVIPGDEIWVAQGVYTPGVSAQIAFTIPPGVAVYGGFGATETARTQRDWTANVTVLSGDIDGNDIYKDAKGVVTSTAGIKGTNAYHVLWLDGTGNRVIAASTRLDGFIVTAGNASGSSPYSDGGGLYCDGEGTGKQCSPSLANLSFYANSASNGGAVYNNGSNGISSPELTNVTFTGNGAMSDGGAMHNNGSNGISSPELTNVTFTGNTAMAGGAMYNNGRSGESRPFLTNTTFASNTAMSAGGAMVNEASSPSLNHATFIYNEAGQYGGAMYNVTGNPVLTNATFHSNFSHGDGGAMYNRKSNPSLTNITFTSNGVDRGHGGAMYNDGESSASSPSLTNVTFRSNWASWYGGAMYNDGYNGACSPRLTNVTFVSNVAGYYAGGAIYNYGHNGASSPSLSNAILWGNGFDEVTDGRQIFSYGSGAAIFIQHSLVQDGWSGSGISNTLGATVIDGGGNISADPLFASAEAGDLRLLPGSPAIDTGNTLSVPAGITADLGGNPRVVNGEVDMGAYESQGYSLTISAGSAQSTTVGSTFAASLLVSVASNSGEPVGPGGTIYFTSPPGGAGLSAAYTATTDISGTALVTVAANTVAGSYAVTATAPGVVAPAIFTLTNTPASLHVIRTGTGHGRVNSQPAGIDCGPTCIAEFDYGQFVTLTATPDAGSAFDGWSGACNGVGVCQATVTRNLSVTATFALLTHTLTTAMAGNGSGSISLTPAGGTYDYGTVVTATATPGTGSSFAGWSGVCSGAGACVVAVTGDGALTATFTLNSHALATGTAGTGAGSISLNPAGGVYDYGTAVTLTATPDAGSLFTAWSGAISSASNPIVLVMDADRSVTATFALNTYVQFSAADFVVDEGAGSATVTITLNTASASPVSVDVATADHTAVAPDDYAVVSATLTYAPGETSQHIQVPIVDDALDEVNQSLTLTLRNPANAWLGSPASARLTILDDDGPLAAFTPPTYSVSESGGQVIITVSLSAASVQTVTLDYATCDGNAIGGHDYIAISGTLILAPGEQTATIRVAILDDETLLEPDETFTLVLDQSVNAVLGTPATATIVIVDNDVNPPPVEVSAPADPASPVTVSVNSPAGTAQITLDDVRSGGMITVLASVTPTDQPPGNFSLLGTSFYIANSGIDFGRATLRLPYRDSDVAAAGVLEQSLRLLHLENGQWIDITTGLDTDANIITGVTESFSPFVFGVQDMLNCAISLNSGARFTSRLGAQVFSNQPDAAEILLGNDAGFTGARWQPYVSALDWTMTDPGNRIVTLLVYARLRDVHGNPLCSGLSVIDDIIYDPLAPSLASIAIQSQASNALWSTAAAPISTTLRVTATDQQGGSGVAGLQISPRADLAGARWQPFSDLAQVTAQPGATLYARVRDGVGNVSNVASVRVPGGDPPSYSAPVVSLTASSPIWLGQPAVFTPSVSTTPPGDPTITYQWSFGDGVASTASNPGHTYTAAGAYTVVLTAINAAGSGVASATVTVYGAPRARFSAYPISGSAPLLVHFTNASTPNGDPTLSYYWSFGDGAVSQLQHPIHIYPAAGSFTAVLTVSNAAGASPAPASLVITVTPPITGSILITPGVASVLTFSAGYTAAIAFDARFADVPITLTYELTHAGGMTESPGQIGAAFVLLAYGPAGNPVTQFSRPFTITIGYADADVAGLNEAVLGLYFWDTQQLRWARIPGRVDIAANRLIAPVNRLARFAVIAQRKTMYLPMLQR